MYTAISTAAAPTFHEEGRTTAQLSDHSVASLVQRRLTLLRRQGWAAFGLFGGALTGLIAAVVVGPTELILGVAGAGIATLAMGLGFFVERLAYLRFRAEGRGYGLNDDAVLEVYRKAAGAEELIDVLRACGREPTDADLARFVR